MRCPVGEVRGIVVRSVLRGNQTDVGGDGCERGEGGLRVGAAHDVQIVDLSKVFPEAEAFSEEEGGKESPFCCLGHPAE